MSALKGARPGAGALTDGESAIMDLWDGGLKDVQEIADRTGYGPTYVREVIKRFSVTEQSLGTFDRMSIAGTASLLRAIQCFHPNFAELV